MGSPYPQSHAACGLRAHGPRCPPLRAGRSAEHAAPCSGADKTCKALFAGLNRLMGERRQDLGTHSRTYVNTYMVTWGQRVREGRSPGAMWAHRHTTTWAFRELRRLIQISQMSETTLIHLKLSLPFLFKYCFSRGFLWDSPESTFPPETSYEHQAKSL